MYPKYVCEFFLTMASVELCLNLATTIGYKEEIVGAVRPREMFGSSSVGAMDARESVQRKRSHLEP